MSGIASLADERLEARGRHASLPGHSSIDELDKKLIAQLLRDARRSFRELARELSVSPSTVIARIKHLEESGIVKGYSVVLDHEKIGFELTVITEIVVSKGKLLAMEREIAKLPGVCAVYDTTGDSDGMVVAKFHDRRSLSAFTKGILALPFVERTNTHLALTTVKENFRLSPVDVGTK